MANPNLLQLTSITGDNVHFTLGTSATSCVLASSNTIVKVVALYVANKSGSTTSFTVYHEDSSDNATYIAYQIDLPPDSSIQLVSKETPLYVKESEEIQALASAASNLDLFMSYEVMS
jgi:hypothetical protein